MDIIITKIIYYLNKNGQTPKNLCNYLGKDEHLFTDWKANRSKSYLKYIKQIADYLEVDITTLYGIEEVLPTNNPLDFELSQEEKDLIVLFHNMTAEQKSKIKSLALSLSLED